MEETMKILRLFALAVVLPLMGCPGDDDDDKTGESGWEDSGASLQLEVERKERRA